MVVQNVIAFTEYRICTRICTR